MGTTTAICLPPRRGKRDAVCVTHTLEELIQGRTAALNSLAALANSEVGLSNFTSLRVRHLAPTITYIAPGGESPPIRPIDCSFVADPSKPYHVKVMSYAGDAHRLTVLLSCEGDHDRIYEIYPTGEGFARGPYLTVTPTEYFALKQSAAAVNQ
ncbi:hypothetical protein HYV82_02845 [Candidatus Woesearchaeota archaeon]|nr:hypothetical protein [Candidatus Woesearchaeota archaeon]